MPDKVELRILGPFELRVDEAPVELRGVKPQQLLATLALHHGRTVSVDHLVEVLWPRDAPRSAVANIQTYVSGLRTHLGEDRLRRQSPGYRLQLGAAELDMAAFEAAAGQTRLSDLDGALSLWHGPPVENLPPSPLWQSEVDRLEELHRNVRRQRARLVIDAGNAPVCLADLRSLVDEDPLHEESWLLLVTGLDAAGRRAEALAAYADARRVLAKELGIEPGEQLQLAYRRMLAVSVGSSARMDADAGTLLKGLAQLGMPSCPMWTASALLDRPAQTVVERLTTAKLLRVEHRRFALPALISLLAVDLPEARSDAADTDAALTRVLGGYLHLAETAARALPAPIFGPGSTVAPRWAVPDTPGEIRDPAVWFATEKANLVRAVELAADADRADLAWELAHALVPWCDLGGHSAVWEQTHQIALAACRNVGDHLGEAVTLRGLGQLHLYHDLYPEALEAFSRARLLFARLGDVRGEAGALSGLGTVNRFRGALDEAQQRYSAALKSYLDIADWHGQAYAHGALGQVWLARGELTAANECFAQGLVIASQVDDRYRIGVLTHLLGIIRLRQGEGDEALALITEALDQFALLGDSRRQAYCLIDLASLGSPTTAVDRLTQALEIFERIGDRRAQAQTARRLGELHAEAGRARLGGAYLDEARRLQALL